MKKTVTLSESELRTLIESTVRGFINEMGTPRQNNFLRSLMGDRYKPEYDNIPPQQMSQMIQSELDRQKNERGQQLATERQIGFIANNKYYAIPTITSVQDQLTKEDATDMISALNPYSDQRATYYGPIRRRKEEWIPNMKEVVVPLLQKYGLNDEAQALTQYADDFIQRNDAKQERARLRQKQQKWEQLQNDPRTLYFISTHDEENTGAHQTVRISNDLYMDGILEEKMGWDMANLATDLTQKTLDEIQEEVATRRDVMTYPTIVLGYDEPCYTLLWMGYDFAHRYGLCGRIIDQTERREAYDFARGCQGRSSDGKSFVKPKM